MEVPAPDADIGVERKEGEGEQQQDNKDAENKTAQQSEVNTVRRKCCFSVLT